MATQSVVLVIELRAVGRPLHQVEREAPTENLSGFSRGAAKSTWVVLLGGQWRAPGALCAGDSDGDSRGDGEALGAGGGPGRRRESSAPRAALGLLR